MFTFVFMEIFPTQYSLLSAAALNDRIAKTYGLSGMTCRLLIHNVSDTYLMENPETKYIFKVYRDAHRKLEEIKGEIELLELLHQGGVNVAVPLKDLKGELVQAFQAAEGIRHGVLFSFAAGEPKAELTDAELVSFGLEMAKFHQLSSRIELSYPRKEFNIETMISAPLQKIKPAFSGLEHEYGYLAATCAKVISKLESLDLSSFATGYCHYDFLPKNFHFDANGTVTLFDFDFAGKGHLVNDLASFYAHYFLLVLHNRITQEEADRAFGVFLQSYRTVCSVSDAEIQSVPYFGFAWWIFYFGFHYDNFEDWSNSFFSPRFIRERVGWIKKWAEWYIPDEPAI